MHNNSIIITSITITTRTVVDVVVVAELPTICTHKLMLCLSHTHTHSITFTLSFLHSNVQVQSKTHNTNCCVWTLYFVLCRSGVERCGFLVVCMNRHTHKYYGKRNSSYTNALVCNVCIDKLMNTCVYSRLNRLCIIL